MQKIILIGVIILSIGAIIAGRFYYGERLDSIATDAQEEMSGGVSDIEETMENEEVSEDTEEASEDVNEDMEDIPADLAARTEGVPEELAARIVENIQNDDVTNIVTLGTRSSADFYDQDVTPWPELFEEQLNEAYGGEYFEVTNITHGEYTSREVIQLGRHTTLEDVEADIIIVEGFNWNDNLAVVPPAEGQENLEAMIAAAETNNPDLIPVLQPSPPAFETSIYPGQIEEFAAFAEEEDYIYIDHWEAWPEIDDEELLEYVDEERMPNQEGHELWSNYVTQTFAAQ